MKVKLVGKEIVSYTKKQTGELKEGISLFYMAPKDKVQGLCTDSIWVGKQSPLYEKMIGEDFSKIRDADVVSEVPPGSRYPVLTEIKLLS